MQINTHGICCKIALLVAGEKYFGQIVYLSYIAPIKLASFILIAFTFAPFKLLPLKFALNKSAPDKLTPCKLAFSKKAPFNLQLGISAFNNDEFIKFEFINNEFVKSVLSKIQPEKFALRKLAYLKFALRKEYPANIAVCNIELLKSNPSNVVTSNSCVQPDSK
ncbi:hypothetical protein A9G42_04775 [Gilliamella sp. Nev6-6]|nr:hypothetical protein A9G42_04775 [Gilliamella apicola]